MSEARIRVAIGGCGVIGRRYGIVLATHPASRWQPSSTLPLPRPRTWPSSSRPGTRPSVSSTLRAVLTRADVAVDLVVVCTPSGTHINTTTASRARRGCICCSAAVAQIHMRSLRKDGHARPPMD